MFIKEIVLDGFKSYARRTVINGFDKTFNAITGLNGSGKSNILDAICFVLGITQLSSVRVNNLQELVYKQGQARVTKASVSITFDNSEKSESPPGYESFDKIVVTREIIVGGRSKYLINGHTTQNNRIQTFFHSVHLNINNPHFLIMQGKITKVLAMRPLEILGMIEEAAGTSMYEIKRNNSLRTIKRKEGKLLQIDNTLSEEISPLLEKLKKQKVHYMTWSSNNTEIERLNRFKIAFLYHSASAVAGKKKDARAALLSKEKDLEETLETLGNEIETLNDDIEKMKEIKSSLKDSKIVSLDSEVAELSKKIAKETTVLLNKKSSLNEEEEALVEANNLILSSHKTVKEKEEIKKENKRVYLETKEKYEEAKSEVNSIQGQQLGFSVGGEQGNKGSAIAQILENKKKKSELETKLRNIRFRKENLATIINEKSRESIKYKNEDTSLNKEIETLSLKIEKLNSKIDNLKENNKQYEELSENIKSLKEKSNRLENLTSRSSRFSFQYKMPLRNFDRSSVHGYVANLITVKNSNYNTALEIAAGSRLRNVVIDSQEVGKQLLRHGKLERRITMIPIDKVVSKRLSRDVMGGYEDVKLALDCVEYPNKYKKVMEFVFGSTVICPNLKIAKEVAFGGKKRLRTVTLSGELFETSGILTGGFRNNAISVLSELQRMKSAEKEAKYVREKLDEMFEQRRKLDEKTKSFRELQMSAQIAEHKLEGLERRRQQTAAWKIKEEIRNLRGELDQFKKEEEDFIGKLNSVEKRIESLKENTKEGKEREENLEKNLIRAKDELEKYEKILSEQKGKVEYDELEGKTLESELSKAEEQKKVSEKNIKILQNEAKETEKNIFNLKEAHSKAYQELKEDRKELERIESRLEQISDKFLESTRQKEADSLELKKIKNDLVRFEKSIREAREKVRHIEREHAWVSTEKKFFGRSGGDYDFEAVKPDYVLSRLKLLEEQQQELSSRINKKVLAMFEKAEQDYNSLVKKRKIVLEDKNKIEKVIGELDRKKNEILKRTFERVNKHFGSIFEELLPGAKAKLVQVNKNSILAGVEVNVAFGSAWKDSLSELSGGQRSLLALSLILSLLLFKPAPVYILDEIDAALDLSHTQNIGRMLSSHFAKAQFLIVSLKEGMFNNANVLFQIKFVNGVSTVLRLEGKGKSDSRRGRDARERSKKPFKNVAIGVQ